MLATPVWWLYVFWLPDHVGKERGFTLKEIGMIGWIPFLTVDIGELLGGAASDHLLAKGRSASRLRPAVRSQLQPRSDSAACDAGKYLITQTATRPANGLYGTYD